MHDTLLQQLPGVWRADSLARMRGAVIPTGYPALDAALGGGWPNPALIELLYDQGGIGELQLLLPLLVAQADDNVLWLNPPHALQAVALAQCGLQPAYHWISGELEATDTLWAMEQALRSGACGIVIAWTMRASMASLRRLKLATSAGRCLGVLFRPLHEAALPSPATLRAALDAHGSCLHLRLLKVQGRLPTAVIIDVQSRSGGT